MDCAGNQNGMLHAGFHGWRPSLPDFSVLSKRTGADPTKLAEDPMKPRIVPSTAALLAVFVLLGLVKLWLAVHLPAFGDEVFYWQASRALAPGYSDLPPLTAALIALGTAIGGDGRFGLRWPFLLIGAAIPWVLRAWARQRGADPDSANRVALFALWLPLIASSGLLALPDVPLTLAMLLAFVQLDRALQTDRWRHWMGLGLAMAFTLLSHWRAALLISAGLVLLLASPRARRQIANPKLWCALAVAAAGLLPVVYFSLGNDWAALRFQLLERNPWRFQWQGLWFVVEQALVVSPALFVLLGAGAIAAWRQRRQAGLDLALAAVLGIWVVYAVAGCFADNDRTRVHWPLPAYLPLLLLVPALQRQWRARGGWRAWLSALALPLCAAATVLLLAAVVLASSPGATAQRLSAHLFGNAFHGWSEAERGSRYWLQRLPADSVLIGDNFLLAAELDFALAGQRPVYVLDHPRNRKHGRQVQLGIWQRDQASLLRTDWRQGLLVIEESARYAGDRLAAWQALCRQFGSVLWLGERRLEASGDHFLYLRVTPPSKPGDGACQVPLIAYLDAPPAGARLKRGEALTVAGWAVRDEIGVARVHVLIDGEDRARADTGLPAPHVQTQWPHSRDPRHPNVGFSATFATTGLARGWHRIDILVDDGQGMQRQFGPRWFELD